MGDGDQQSNYDSIGNREVVFHVAEIQCAHSPKMNCNFRAKRINGVALSILLALFAFADTLRAQNSEALQRADQAFIQALGQQNRNALDQLLDANFIWIDSNGKRLSSSLVLEELPGVANSRVDIEWRAYGKVAVVRANHSRVNVLRVWVKRSTGWRALLYQEVTQVEKSESPGGAPSEECINPCKTIPYQPETPSEKEAIASWQGVMKAMAENDADAYSPLIAEEFTATDTYHDRPYTKADRLVQISKQKEGGKRSSPPELIAAEMFDLGETVMMVAREQRPGAKSYFNTRMWVKRDARWQMLLSFNTRIE